MSDEEEQLSRFADHLKYKVDHREGGKHDRDDARDPNRSRRVGDQLLRPLYAATQRLSLTAKRLDVLAIFTENVDPAVVWRMS